MATPENSIKTNIQIFRNNDEFTERMFRAMNAPNELQQKFLWLFNDTFATSKYFGYFIWDNGLSDLSPFFSRDYFAANWNAILDAFKIAGTFEAYLLIIKSALGQDTVITFESPTPSHLIINISEPTGLFTWGAYTQNETMDVVPDQAQYPDSVFSFSQSLGGLTVNETLALIDLLNVNGVFVEVSFTDTDSPTVTLDPIDTTVAEGETATFSATAISFDTVQWWFSSDLGGTWEEYTFNPTGQEITLVTNAQPIGNDGYLYKAIFTNSVGETETTTAEVTVFAVGAELIPQPLDIQVAPWAASADAVADDANTYTTTAAGGMTAAVGLLFNCRVFYDITTGAFEATIKDSTGAGADPTIVTIPAGTTQSGYIDYLFTSGSVYVRSFDADTVTINALSIKEIL